MISRYGIICEVVRLGSFSKAAEKFGYAQSSVSGAVKSLEEELGVSLIDRKRHGISWTADGEIYAPYFARIYMDEEALSRKAREMEGLEGLTIRIGTFTSVSRDILPPLMQKFRELYPRVSFELHQGGYTEIRTWLEGGQIDLGFLAGHMTEGLPHDFLYEDRMLAVFPSDHPKVKEKEEISLSDFAEEPFILIDEGAESSVLKFFAGHGMEIPVAYKVSDDYSIISMVKNHLGVSILFDNVVYGYETEVAVRPLKEPIRRRVCLAYRDETTLPYAASRFRSFIRKEIGKAEGNPIAEKPVHRIINADDPDL